MRKCVADELGTDITYRSTKLLWWPENICIVDISSKEDNHLNKSKWKWVNAIRYRRYAAAEKLEVDNRKILTDGNLTASNVSSVMFEVKIKENDIWMFFFDCLFQISQIKSKLLQICFELFLQDCCFDYFFIIHWACPYIL